MEIKSEEYSVTYDPTTVTVTFFGKLRLYDYTSYQPIEELLHSAITESPAAITLDICKLEFINSSGIDMLYRFAHKVSSRKNSRLIARKSKRAASWQNRLLSTIEMMAPNLQIEIVDEAQ